jgi:hypothetical protein
MAMTTVGIGMIVAALMTDAATPTRPPQVQT